MKKDKEGKGGNWTFAFRCCGQAGGRSEKIWKKKEVIGSLAGRGVGRKKYRF